MGGGDMGEVLDDAFWRSLCRALGSTIDGSVSCIDRQRRILYISRRRPNESPDAVGKPVEQVVAPLERAAAVDCIERAFQTHEAQRLEYGWTAGDGRRLRSITRIIPFEGPGGEELVSRRVSESEEQSPPKDRGRAERAERHEHRRAHRRERAELREKKRYPARDKKASGDGEVHLLEETQTRLEESDEHDAGKEEDRDGREGRGERGHIAKYRTGRACSHSRAAPW